MINSEVVDEPEATEVARELKDLLDLIHVALGDMRLYGSRHPVTRRRLREAWVCLDEVLRLRGSLRLSSGHDGLSWEGTVVRPEADDREGLGRLLHREGIRTLILNQGVDEDELRSLLETLRVNLALPENEEETLESLLWQVGFQNIEVEAFQELRDAEVLSGELWRRGDGDDAGEVIRQLLALRVDSGRARSRISTQVSEAALHRAVAESNLSGLGGTSDGAHGLADHRRWVRLLNREGADDHLDLAAVRDSIAADNPGLLLSHLVFLLLRVSLSGREELPFEDAVELARTAADELFRRGLPGGVLALVEGAPSLLRSAPPEAMHRLGDLLRFTEEVTQPSKVAAMLVKLDPTHHADDAGLANLVNWLPDSSLEQVLESAGRHLGAEQREWLLELLGSAAQERFAAWLADIDRQPQARILVIVQMLRSLKSEAGKVQRARLMEHPSREVRLATLDWYMDDLPDDEVDKLLPSLLDRHESVRRAARTLFAYHRHPKAYTWLRTKLTRDYDRLDPELKKDLCTALGQVGGDLGLGPLMEIFDRKVPVFGGRDAAVDLIASSLGLAASGSVQARIALEKGASSLNRTRRSVCQDALLRFGRGS